MFVLFVTYLKDSYCMEHMLSMWDREVADDRKTLEKELALTRKKCDLLLSRVDAKVGCANNLEQENVNKLCMDTSMLAQFIMAEPILIN